MTLRSGVGSALMSIFSAYMYVYRKNYMQKVLSFIAVVVLCTNVHTL